MAGDPGLVDYLRLRAQPFVSELREFLAVEPRHPGECG